MKNKQTPAQIIEGYLDDRGVTKANAARKIGMSYESFRALFTGKCVWRVETLVSLIDLLRLTDKEVVVVLDSFRH